MREIILPDPDGFVPTWLSNDSPQSELWTDEPGTLRLKPDWFHARFKLSIKRQEKDSRTLVSCRTRIPDREGTVWEAESLFTPSIFIEKLLDLNRMDRPMFEVHARSEDEISQALQQPPLVSGINELLDDRFYRFFWVSNRLLQVVFKYQAPSCDVFPYLENRVLIRVSGLWGEWCTVEPAWELPERIIPYDEDNEEDEDGIEYWGDFEEVPAIVYELWATDLIFHHRVDLAVYDETGGADCINGIPIPLRFHRTSLTETAQESVQFCPWQASQS